MPQDESVDDAARARLTRSLSMSLLYDDDGELNAQFGQDGGAVGTDESPRESLVAGIDELLDELRGVHKNISDQALEHIHADEGLKVFLFVRVLFWLNFRSFLVILTAGYSRTVEQFLRAAARKRSYKVFVAQTAPRCDGHIMAQKLAAAG